MLRIHLVYIVFLGFLHSRIAPFRTNLGRVLPSEYYYDVSVVLAATETSSLVNWVKNAANHFSIRMIPRPLWYFPAKWS